MGRMKVQSFNTPINELEHFLKRASARELRPAQIRALTLMQQGRNVALIWPTGMGKSLCYQLPVLAAGEGRGLVVSPLIALMEDQVAQSWCEPWPVTCIHSNLSREQREARLAQFESGEVRLLYVTPERLRVSGVLERLKNLDIQLLAIDEAHCISQWGHDFRPDYSRLGDYRKALGQPQTVLLTATATPDVQADMIRTMGLEGNIEVLGEGFERPGLHLSVVEVAHEDEKWEQMKKWLYQVEGPKLIYFTLISKLE